jgi:aspartate/tyrosine/aromatic aminotransferase
MSLGVGAYRTDEEKPYVFEVIKEIEKELYEDLISGKINKEYLPIEGHAGFCEESKKLIFGRDCKNIDSIVTVQSISGSGALRVGGEFLKKFMPETVYIPNPTWGNHISIFENSGLKTVEYPYFDAKDKNLDFEGMTYFLKELKEGSIVLLHASAHNPTGVDPTLENWREIADIMKSRKLFPLIDTAYQGYASGSLETDAYPIRLFNERGFQMLVAQSYADNMGLYGERIGALHVVCSSNQTAEKVLSQLKY